MTAVDDRPQAWDDAQMLPETFEEIAAVAARAEEGLRFELMGGKLGVKRVPDALHAYRNGRARPDGVLAPIAHFVGRTVGEWADPDGGLMTVEVTSRDRDTNQRNRVDKPRSYAEAGIPGYLLIDRDGHAVSDYSDPAAGAYLRQEIVAFGKTVTLPEPVGIELDTQQLLTWSTDARS